MSGAGDQSPFTGSRRLSGGSREAAGDRGESEAPEFPGWGLLRRMAAAGVVVAVAACLCWVPVRGLPLDTSRPDRHAARLLAGLGKAGTSCGGVAVLAGPECTVPSRYRSVLAGATCRDCHPGGRLGPAAVISACWRPGTGPLASLLGHSAATAWPRRGYRGWRRQSMIPPGTRRVSTAKLWSPVVAR
jgi:hypothetical protein